VSVGLVALMVGLFAVPLALLALGHRLRRRSASQRTLFWGALAGYSVAGCAVLIVAMIPAQYWSGENTVRGAIGWWGLIAGPAVGGTASLAWRALRSGGRS
jgi:hypothetical protein